MRVSRRIAVITARELKRFIAHAAMRASRKPESTARPLAFVRSPQPRPKRFWAANSWRPYPARVLVQQETRQGKKPVANYVALAMAVLMPPSEPATATRRQAQRIIDNLELIEEDLLADETVREEIAEEIVELLRTQDEDLVRVRRVVLDQCHRAIRNGKI